MESVEKGKEKKKYKIKNSLENLNNELDYQTLFSLQATNPTKRGNEL